MTPQEQALIYLQKQLEIIGKIEKGMDKVTFKEAIKSSRIFQNQLLDIEESLEDQSDLYGDINNRIKLSGEQTKTNIRNLKETDNIVEILNKKFLKENKIHLQTKNLKQGSISIHKNLVSLNEQLIRNQYDILEGESNSKNIQKDIIKSKQIEQSINLRQIEIAKERKEIQSLTGEEFNSLSSSQQADLIERNKQLINESRELDNQSKLNKDITNELNKQLESTENVEKSIGIVGTSLEILKTIPGLSKIIDIEDAEKAMEITARTIEARKELNKLSGKKEDIFSGVKDSLNIIRSGLPSLGVSITKALGPLALIAGVVKTFSFIKDIMFEADERMTGLAKTLNVTKGRSEEIYESWNQNLGILNIQANLLEGQTLNRKNLIESQNKYNELLGTSINLLETQNNKGINIASQFSKISKYLKLSDEEQKGLLESTSIYGNNIDDIEKTIIKINVQRKLEGGVLLNTREIIKDVLTTHNSIKLSIKGGLDSLTEATIQAKKLGLNLNQIDKIADNFLDFESSINSQLEAELLTGQNINLEQERYFALTNDIEGLTKEIGNNQQLINTFSNSNRITQGAIAASLGISREEMSDMIVKQKQLNLVKSNFNQLENDTIDSIIEKKHLEGDYIKRLQEGKGTVDDYYKLAKEGQLNLNKLFEDQEIAGLEATSAQDKFNETLESLKEKLSALVDSGALDTLTQGLMNLSNSWLFKGTREKVLKENIKEFKKEKQFEDYTDKQKSSFDRLVNMYEKVGGVNEIALKNILKNPNLITKEGQIESNVFRKITNESIAEDFISRPGQPIQKFRKDDLIIGGTQLTKNINDYKSIEDIINNSNKIYNENNYINNKNTTISNNQTLNNPELLNEFKEMKNIMMKLLNKEGNIYMDSYKVGTSINLGTYKSVK